MITPTDEQVEAALLPCPFCGTPARVITDSVTGCRIECHSIDCFGPVTSWYGAYPDAKTAWNHRALTAAFSLAPAGTVEVKPLTWHEYSLPHEYGAGSWEAFSFVRSYVILDVGTDGKNGARYYLRGFAQFGSLDEAKAHAQKDFEAAIRTTLLPPQPSAALPGLLDEEAESKAFMAWARHEWAVSPPHNTWLGWLARAALVSQPQPEGEAVAWRWAHADDPFYWNLQKAEPGTAAWIIKQPLYLHPAPTLQGAGLIEALTLLRLFREAWSFYVTQTKIGIGNHHPIWQQMAEVLGDDNHKAMTEEEYRFVTGPFFAYHELTPAAALSPQTGSGK